MPSDTHAHWPSLPSNLCISLVAPPSHCGEWIVYLFDVFLLCWMVNSVREMSEPSVMIDMQLSKQVLNEHSLSEWINQPVAKMLPFSSMTAQAFSFTWLCLLPVTIDMNKTSAFPLLFLSSFEVYTLINCSILWGIFRGCHIRETIFYHHRPPWD